MSCISVKTPNYPVRVAAEVETVMKHPDVLMLLCGTLTQSRENTHHLFYRDVIGALECFLCRGVVRFLEL